MKHPPLPPGVTLALYDTGDYPTWVMGTKLGRTSLYVGNELDRELLRAFMAERWRAEALTNDDIMLIDQACQNADAWRKWRAKA